MVFVLISAVSSFTSRIVRFFVIFSKSTLANIIRLSIIICSSRCVNCDTILRRKLIRCATLYPSKNICNVIRLVGVVFKKMTKKTNLKLTCNEQKNLKIENLRVGFFIMKNYFQAWKVASDIQVVCTQHMFIYFYLKIYIHQIYNEVLVAICWLLFVPKFRNLRQQT